MMDDLLLVEFREMLEWGARTEGAIQKMLQPSRRHLVRTYALRIERKECFTVGIPEKHLTIRRLCMCE